jgi:flagellar biogenesis protein FliO
MRIAQMCGGAVLLWHAALATGAENAPLTQGQDIVAVPGIGRVVVVFLLVAALAVAAAVVLRRMLPKITGVTLGGNALRVLERTNLSPATRLHLVQVEGEKLLVAENRNGLAVVVLARNLPANQP